MERKVLLFVMYLMMVTQSSENVDKKDLVPMPPETTEADLNGESVSETSFQDDNDFEVFQATNEWQTVKEGQAIPQGLHVQIDLQTGKKRAKLLDENNKENEKKDTVESQKHLPKQKYIEIDKKFISKQKLKDALREFKDKFHNEDLEHEDVSDHEKNKYRSMEELKNELEGANIWMKKDIEIIQELVAKLNNSKSSKTEIVKALDELEHYVHQIDNARDLDIIGGLAIVVGFLNQTDEAVKSQAAHVIGSAAQSNTPVQVSLLHSGALPLLTRLLADRQSSLTTRKKAMYALSSMLRLFPKGTQRFLKIGGLSVLASLFQESANDPLRVKALTLLVDLLVEQMDSIRKKAKEMGIQDYEKATLKAPLLKTLYQEGWCELSTSLMTTTENDAREKILQALHVLLPACRKNFKKGNLTEKLTKWRQEWQDEINMDNQDDTEYLQSLVTLTDGLVGKL